jgi:hypothetical protein
MPQIDEKDLPRLVADSVSSCGCEFAVVDPLTLHAHQRVQHDKAVHMPREVVAKPVVISEDGFILDGHHRWYAHKLSGDPLLAIRVQLEFEKALDWLLSLEYTYKLTRDTPLRN